MGQNNNEKEQMVKNGAKLAIKAATAPIKTMILGAVATILPYILVGLLIFVVIFCVYLGTLEQVDQILVDSEDWGERIGNAVSLHGFKTNEKLEEDEEGKYFSMLDLYKKIFKFNNYEISLMNQTLLYEGSSEERIYLSESSAGFIIVKQDGVTLRFPRFIKNILTHFQRGFATSVAGQSQYLKANKNMLVNAAALKKCGLRTNKDKEKEAQCYKGYLIAEYNMVTDYYIDCYYGKILCLDKENAIETDVEPGFLIVPNNIIGQTVGITNEIADIRNDIIAEFSKFTITGPITKEILEKDEIIRDALTLFVFGTLAEADDIHFYYDGYIVNNLKEEYKLFNNLDYDLEKFDQKVGISELFEKYDKERIRKERKNRRKTSDMINDLTETYFDLTYGPDKIEEKFAEIVASNESKASVIIDEDGNSVSFDDYVMIYALANYSDEIKEIVDSGENVDERLRALMILARTQIYGETGFNHSSAEVTGNFDTYELGMEIYDSFKNDSKMYKYLANLSTAIAGSRGRTIKVNGQVVTLTPEQIDQVLDSVQNGGTIDDSIGNVIPDASLNVTFSPLPEGSFTISSEYGEVRGNETHNAIDYHTSDGTNISAIVDGTVVASYDSCDNNGFYGSTCGGGFGNHVVVQYGNYYVIYGHMYPGSVNVSVGDKIQAGQNIGQVGSSGSSTGSHLHLEVRIGGWGKGAETINPNSIINGG